MSQPSSLALQRAGAVSRGTGWRAADSVRLDYEGRFLRRKRLRTEAGLLVLVDLPGTVSLDDGDALVLEDGRLIGVIAAPEPLLQVRGPSLARLAWHIGNRHTPCAIRSDRLEIRFDPVLAEMLRGLGAEVTAVEAPFLPEGGAYGHGRTLGHSHGPAEGGVYRQHGRDSDDAPGWHGADGDGEVADPPAPGHAHDGPDGP